MLARDFLLNETFPFSDFILSLNRRLLYFIKELGLELPVNQSHILIELNHHRRRTAKEISEILQIEKSTLSRSLQALIQQKLIATVDHPEDSRSKFLSLTVKGEKAIAVDLVQRNTVAQRCCGPLSKELLNQFTEILAQLADGVEAPQLEAISSEDPAEAQFRRLTRSLGAINKNFFQSGRLIEEYQVFFLLWQNQGSMSFADLQSTLGYEVTVFSKLISKLQKEGITKKISSTTDKRAREIQLTKKGSAVVAAMLGAGERFLSRALGKGKQVLLPRMQTIASQLFLQSDVTARSVQTLTAKDKRIEARTWLVQHYLSNNKLHEIPHEIITDSDICLAAYDNNNIVGLLVARPSKGATVIRLLLANDDPSRKILLATLLKAERGPYAFDRLLKHIATKTLHLDVKQKYSKSDILRSLS